DPELRFTQAGQPVLNMRLATTESWFDKTANERKEKTEWHNTTVFGKRGEGLAKLLKKGDRLIIEGRLQTSSYEDREGVKRYETNVVALSVVLKGSRNGNGDRRQAGTPPNDFDSGGNADDQIPY